LLTLTHTNIAGVEDCQLNAENLLAFKMPQLETTKINFTINAPNASIFELPKLTAAFGTFSIVAGAKIIDLSNLKVLAGANSFYVEGDNVTDIKFGFEGISGYMRGELPALLRLDGSKCKRIAIYYYASPLLESIDFSNLIFGAVEFYTGAFAALDLPNFVYGGFYLDTLPNFTNLNVPKLENLDYFYLYSCPNFTSLSLPSVRYLYGIGFGDMTNLEEILLPSIEILSSIDFTNGLNNLARIEIGSNLKEVAYNFVITSCALDQSSVDNILVRLAALDGTNGTTLYQNKTVTITGTSAAPSSTGIAAKAILAGRGCVVTTN